MRSRLAILTPLVILLSSCGPQDEQPADAQGQSGVSAGDSSQSATSAEENQVETDTVVTAGVIAVQFDMASGFVAGDGGINAGSSLRLMSDNTTERNCEVGSDGLAAVVTEKDEIKDSKSRLVGGVVRTADVLVSREATLNWSNDNAGVALSCNAAATQLALNDLDMTDLKVAASTVRKRTVTVTFSRGSIKVTGEREFTNEEQRNVKWLSDEKADGVRTLKKQVSAEAAVTMTLPNKDKDKVSLEATVTTAEDDPFLIENLWSTTDGQWQSGSIQSGSLISEFPGGRRIKESYVDVAFVQTAGCYPESGTIKGEIYSSSTAEKPQLTYSKVFDGTSLTITFSDGTEQELPAEGCALEDATTDRSDVETD